MKSKLTLLLIGTSCILSQTASAILVHDRRCDTWGDSLSGPEATQRVAFALACEKDPKVLREIKIAQKGVIAKDGSSGIGYPSYGQFSLELDDFANPKGWFAPPKVAGACPVIPAGYEVAFFCAAGCYTPEQEILSSAGVTSVAKAAALKVGAVQSLTASSSMDQLQYQFGEVLSYISDAKAGNQDILRFKMLSGGQLRVTLNHPLVNAAGEVAQAQSFKAGEALVAENGELDPILSVEKEVYFGKVYNLRMTSEDLKENILVVQGYLNGSVRYQNEYVSQLNRQLLRSVVARNLLNS